MTREIKFRAWDGLNKKFTYWTMNDLCTWDTKIEKPSALDDWQACTGLKDKNGKDIYEGDIVMGYFNQDEVEDWLWMRLTKEEKESGSKVFIVNDIHFGRDQEPIPEDLEVIGNIHENNELLNPKPNE